MQPTICAHGRLVNNQNVPLPSYFLEITASKFKVTVQTDKEGRFSFPLPKTVSHGSKCKLKISKIRGDGSEKIISSITHVLSQNMGDLKIEMAKSKSPYYDANTFLEWTSGAIN